MSPSRVGRWFKPSRQGRSTTHHSAKRCPYGSAHNLICSRSTTPEEEEDDEDSGWLHTLWLRLRRLPKQVRVRLRTLGIKREDSRIPNIRGFTGPCLTGRRDGTRNIHNFVGSDGRPSAFCRCSSSISRRDSQDTYYWPYGSSFFARDRTASDLTSLDGDTTDTDGDEEPAFYATLDAVIIPSVALYTVCF